MSTNISDLKQKTGVALADRPPKEQVKALLQQNRAQIVAALPAHVKPERMMQVALTAALSTPELLNCYTPSLFGALVKCTQLGLEPNNALGHAYLVPFKNKKKNRKDVQVIIGYRGLITLARRSAEIQSISAYAVKEGDDFSYEYGLDEHLRHVPCENPGRVTHFYAYAKYKDGGHNFEVLTNEQVQRIMKSTQSRGESGPWKDHYEEMGRKTAIRRLAKYLPMQIELAEAVAIDETADRNVSQEMDRVLEGDYTINEPSDADFEGQGALEDYSENDPPPKTAAPATAKDDGTRPGAETPEQRAARQLKAGETVTDANGEIYDPNKHAASHETGGPVFNKDGSFRARRGAAKSDEPEATPSAGTSASKEPEPTKQEAPPAAREPGSDDDDPGFSDEDFSLE